MKSSVELKDEIVRLQEEFLRTLEQEAAAPLLACPFCGSSAEFKEKHGDWGYSSTTVWVECSQCLVALPAVRCEAYEVSHEDRIAAIHKWNERKA